ncbi:MAG: quinone-dependent dihydroorotate dehydrogenase [Pseudomonadota bacterium]
MSETIERLGLAALRAVEPERAHRLALRALRMRHALGLSPGGPVRGARLGCRAMGMEFANPVGVAAGFDKNAEAVAATLASGPGFVEVGAVTPRPQPGNPRPRLFRLPEDRAVINRFGFNNDGMEAVAARLEAARARAPLPGPVGVNLGANKDSEDRAGDYAAVLSRFAGLAEFFTVNVSSPNTERLRELQGRSALDALLARCLEARERHAPGAALLVKIAPDLEEAETADVAEVCLDRCLDGIVATNTTLSHEGLKSPRAREAGGLSGAPLFARSTAVLRRLAELTEGRRIALVGVGGVASGADAYAKIRAGASLVQLYTGMVYGGVSLAGRIARELDGLLARDGFASVAEAVGADRGRGGESGAGVCGGAAP